jgi:ABC-type nitrate/sulfonate/bicarbonate transport system substrate-binding protein
MIELLRTDNPVLISALMAALAEAGIDAVEFDGIADIYGSAFPRRLMVLEDDLIRARRIASDICPEFLE